MLTIAGISKRLGGKTLFEDASLQLSAGDKLGLVGPNGAGKSTLFKMILGEEEPDDGAVRLEKRVRIGHLPQESAPVGDETVLEVALAVSPEMTRVRRRIAALEAGGVGGEHEAGDEHLHGRFEALGGHALEVMAQKMLTGLGFREKDLDRPARELSGGWVMRAHLARLLALEPDLLLLDEPTNHLDLDSLLWFADHLAHSLSSVLVISHDREFLNEVTGATAEIRQRRLVRYRGNYDAYLRQKVEADERQRLDFDSQKAEIERLKSLIARFGAKANKAAQANSWKNQIERMEKLEPPAADQGRLNFRLPQPAPGGRIALTLEKIRFGYNPAAPVYENLEFRVERGWKLVLAGPNGAGKSTLLKLLAGVLEPQAGGRKLGYNTAAGYFSQYRLDVLRAGRTALEEAMAALRDAGNAVSEEQARAMLGCFLFRGDDVFKRVEVLSGGEKTRLALVRLLLNPPNLILMDEPTTHLDLQSVEALVQAAKQYTGTLVFISHDLHFIRSVANRVVRVDNGKIEMYEGDWEYYQRRRAAPSGRTVSDKLLICGAAPPPPPQIDPRAEKSTAPAAPRDRKAERRANAEVLDGKNRERRAKEAEVTKYEAEIQALEVRAKALTGELEDPAIYDNAPKLESVNRELTEIQKKLPELNAAWENAAWALNEG